MLQRPGRRPAGGRPAEERDRPAQDPVLVDFQLRRCSPLGTVQQAVDGRRSTGARSRMPVWCHRLDAGHRPTGPAACDADRCGGAFTVSFAASDLNVLVVPPTRRRRTARPAGVEHQA